MCIAFLRYLWCIVGQMSPYYTVEQVSWSKNETACLKNIKKCSNTKISFYLETSGGQNSNLFLNVVYFFKTSVN